MSGFNHEFKRYIYLPSGGAEYPPDFWLGNLTIEYVQLIQDSNAINTSFENIIQVLRRYSSSEVSINDMFVSDVYFVWANILMSDIEKKSYVCHSFQCVNPECKRKNNVRIDFSKLRTRIFNPYKEVMLRFLVDIIFFDGKKYTIEYDMRRVKNNLHFIYQNLGHKSTIVQRIVNYLVGQTKSIVSEDGEVIPKNNFYWFYIFVDFYKLFDIFDKVCKYNFSYGIENDISYVCKYCKQRNNINTFNDFTMCEFSIGGINESERIENYKRKLEFMQLHLLDIDQLMQIPLKEFDTYNNALNQIKILPRVSMF